MLNIYKPGTPTNPTLGTYFPSQSSKETLQEIWSLNQNKETRVQWGENYS